MKRRSAVKSILIISSGIAILPSCRPEVKGPEFSNVPLENGEYDFIRQLTEAILSPGNSGVVTPEPPSDFILTVLNDCTAPEDVKKYLSGLKEFQTYVKTKYNAAFDKLGAEQKSELFAHASDKEKATEPLKYFFDTTRQLTVEHFTSSEYFLTRVLDWQFAPGRFAGCVAV